MIDTVSEYLFAIKSQLEKQYEAEITRHQEKEIEHRKEIVRILSTHEAPKIITAGGPEGDSLLEGYKGENERLYAKAKGKNVVLVQGSTDGTFRSYQDQ